MKACRLYSLGCGRNRNLGPVYTGEMKSLWLVIIAVVMSGCGNKTPVAAVPPSAPDIDIAREIIPPEKDGLAIRTETPFYGLLTKTDMIQVGHSQDFVERVMPSPAGSFPIRSLPPAFKPPFRAMGYESGGSSFGTIYFEDKLALAMSYSVNINPTGLRDLTARYITAFGDPTVEIQQGMTHYRFWENASQRLMICSHMEPSNKYSVTEAVGHVNVMDALRMGQKQATNDVANLNRLKRG